MTPTEYQRQVRRTVPESYPKMGTLVNSSSKQHLIHGLLGISTEAGELTDAIKKWLIYGKEIEIENIDEECGDLCWYINLVLIATGGSFEKCLQKNIDKLRLRYPEKFTEKDALERKDKA